MTETISIVPEAFLESLREQLRLCAPAHQVSFAAVLAERRLASTGEYADWEPRIGQGASLRQIMESVWDHACGRDMAPDRIGGYEASLSEIAALVDPDRFAAFEAYRGIWLLRLTIRRCAPGAGADAVMKVAQASLQMSAGCDLSEGYVSDWLLREKWNNPGAQEEARLQNELIRTLRATPLIGRDTVEELRRNFVT